MAEESSTTMLEAKARLTPWQMHADVMANPIHIVCAHASHLKLFTATSTHTKKACNTVTSRSMQQHEEIAQQACRHTYYRPHLGTKTDS